uniref:Uncharacterized protein n=1 Tax=Noctiluca scintillans TaxID=2966 RepID=A0A7S1A654_NOCSC|mmetsp:Transcript_32901/g.88272  ORF Transcript_32901/g.88272 Transcript_32901/m.88272 type:complete len:295 (+) Transcript_32901:77-961(+)
MVVSWSFWFLACLVVVHSARITNDLDEEDDFGIQEISHLEIEEQEHPSLYLNILVVKTPDAITDQKVAEMEGSPILKKLAAHMVHRKVTKDVVAEKVAEMLPSMLPENLAEMGIDAQADEVFRRAAFTVVRVIVVKSNLTRIMTLQGAGGQASMLDKVWSWGRALARLFGAQQRLDDSVNGVLNRKVAAQMCEKLGELLPQKLAEKGIDVNVTALLEADQAKYFYNFLKVLDAQTAANTANSGAADGSPGQKMKDLVGKMRESKTETGEMDIYDALEHADLDADALEQLQKSLR